jgi:hypothetical protein
LAGGPDAFQASSRSSLQRSLRRRHSPAEVHVEPAPAPLGILLGEARDVLADAAAQLVAGLDAVQNLSGLDPWQGREGHEGETGGFPVVCRDPDGERGGD